MKIFLILLTALMVAMTACSSAPAASAPPQTTSVAPPPSTPAAPPPASTPVASSAAPTPGPSAATSASSLPPASQLAGAGQTVYSGKCGGCHGAQGQGGAGPALIGSGAHLNKYNTGQGLLSFISTSMPFNAPGSLSADQYLQITVYLLVQNNVIAGAAAFDPTKLGQIAIK